MQRPPPISGAGVRHSMKRFLERRKIRVTDPFTKRQMAR